MSDGSRRQTPTSLKNVEDVGALSLFRREFRPYLRCLPRTQNRDIYVDPLLRIRRYRYCLLAFWVVKEAQAVGIAAYLCIQ